MGVASGWTHGLVDSLSGPIEQKQRLVHLHKERVFVQLGPKEERPLRSGSMTPRPRTTCQGPEWLLRI
jgi:hypothetical protein